MPELSAELRTRVEALAGRLSQMRTEATGGDGPSGTSALKAVVDQELVSVEPAFRRSFLEALEERLPSWKSTGAASPDTSDPDVLVSRLIELAASMSDADRATAAERLKAAGFAVQAEGGLPAVPAQHLQSFLGHGSKDRLDPVRTLELTRIAVEFVSSIDRSVSASWRAVAPNSKIRHTAGSKATMARFVAGDAQITRAQVQQDMDRLRTLAGGLVSAVERAGEQFAQRHLERFAPSEIESMAKLVPGSLVALDVKCWRKYKELAEHSDKAAIEQDLRSAIAEYTERLIEGLGR